MYQIFLFLFAMTGLAQSPEVQLKKYYLPHFKPALISKKDSLLINLNLNRVSYTAETISEFFEEPKQSSSFSAFHQREYLIQAWANQFPESPVLQNEDLAQHLQIFSGASAPHLYEKIFPTQTILGEVYGAYMLASGSTDQIAEIQKRQNWIRTLHENHHLRSIILKAGKSVQEIESSLFELARSLQDSMIQEDTQHWIPFVLQDQDPEWLLLQNPLKLPNLILKQHARILFMPAGWIALKATMAGFFSIKTYGVTAFVNGFLWRTFALFLGGTTALESGLLIYQQTQNHQRLRELNISLTKQLKAFAVLLQALSQIAQEPAIPKDLQPKVSPVIKEQLNQIFASISELSEPDDSHFFHANLTRAQLILNQVSVCQQTLKRLLFVFARLDFYASVTDSQFAYVDLLEAKLPSFKATGLRHPSLSSEISIKNNIEIRGANILLTGPNASGKSTLMRSVGINLIYLAQTLGIATADSLALTPFSSVHAFMETQDKTGESSSYQTELNRIVGVIKIKKRSFYLADELFSSTNYQDAITGSVEILNEFSKKNQTLGIVSTHLYALSELAPVRNFHMDNYHLYQNASAKHNALEIFQKEVERASPVFEKTQATSPIGSEEEQLVFEILSSDFRNRSEIQIDSDTGSVEILNEFSKKNQTFGIVSTHLYALSELAPVRNFHMDNYHLYQNASAKHNALEIFQKEFEILSPDSRNRSEIQIDSDIWTDLDLFALRMFPIKTHLGNGFKNLFLRDSLTANIETLKNRQKKIKSFIKKPDLLREIRILLSSFQKVESSLLEVYTQKSFINSRLIQEQYPQDEEILLKLMPNSIPEEQKLSTAFAFNRNIPQLLLHNLLYVYLIVPVGILSNYQLGEWVLGGSSSLYSKAIFGVSTLLSLQGLLAGPTDKHFQLRELNTNFSKKLQDTARAFEVILKLADLDGALASGLKFEISAQECMSIEKFIYEVNALDNSQSHLYQLNFSRALASFRLLMNIRGPFIKYLKKLAKLDFYAAIAQQMLLDPTGVTFAEFVSNHPAVLKAENLWNPHLAREIAVTNDLSMGGFENPRAVIITGPNASGKSTLMRSVAMNIYLAQTLGVAIASRFQLTPFTILNSFMRHQDATGTESSYQSEVKNMRRIMAIYEKMSPQDRAFLILDEPFRSTNPEDAEIASARVLKNLAGYPQSLFIVATHLRNLTDFDQKHLENYKLKDGFSFESSALSMLREKLLGL